MNKKAQKPCIVWVLQDNQLSPIIIEYLKLLKKGVSKIDIVFMIPFQDEKAFKMAKELNPIPFKVSQHTEPRSMENYFKKRDQIKEAEFDEGLKVWRVLLADDLGEGVISIIKLHFDPVPNVRGLILQIPTPLGSSTAEEFIFYAWVKLAREKNLFVAGYELLPLNTRWTLIPSMVDGVITTNEFSKKTLEDPRTGIKGKIWQLPRNEAKVFSPGTGPLWQNGLESPYLNRLQHNIAPETISLYIPHNVALGHEYRRLLEEIKDFGANIHLMFTVGKDQIRGTHSHEEIIKTASKNTLDHFRSCSFHDLNAVWEMVGANAVLACAHGFSTKIAEANSIPCCIIDEYVTPLKSGHIEIVNDYDSVRRFLKSTIEEQSRITDLTQILHEIVQNQHPKVEV